MKFVLNADAGSDELSLSGEEYKYLIKVRRHTIGDLMVFRSRENLHEAYLYRLERTDGRNAYFTLQGHHRAPCELAKKLHIGWCLVDPKTIEKALPTLSELGVAKITFIHCRRSQRNFRLDFERFERIMESSIMQCGRTSLIELAESSTLSAFLDAYPEALILDFSDEVLKSEENMETVIIGCEGGFDESERKLFASHRVRVLKTPMILRSETAAIAVAAMNL